MNMLDAWNAPITSIRYENRTIEIKNLSREEMLNEALRATVDRRVKAHMDSLVKAIQEGYCVR